jgi:MFS family permease
MYLCNPLSAEADLIRQDFGELYNGKMILPALWQGLWNGFVQLGAMMGSVLNGWLQDRFGRRLSFVIGGGFACAGNITYKYFHHVQTANS